MPATVANVRSGVRDVDALLEDAHWAPSSLTFSFPASGAQYTGYGPGEEPFVFFQSFNSLQQIRVRQVLSEISSVARLDFSEVSGGSGDLRYGMSDVPDAAHAYTPTSAVWGGDSWYNNSSRWYDDPRMGNYAYHALLHETGHAVGLKHPHESHQFGPMSADHDWMAYSVMSYRSYPGDTIEGGYVNEDNGYAQSLMMYDIAALQHMYGARFDTVPTNSVYRWTPAGEIFVNDVAQATPSANRIFRTIWDGGGIDTYDLSAYDNDLRIDLGPGEWSTISPAQLPNLGGSMRPPGNIANAMLYKGDLRSLIENVVGGTGDDVIVGNQVANRLNGGAGADRLVGGLGDDVYEVDSTRDRVEEAVNGGIDTVESSASYTLSSHIESLVLVGSAVGGVGNALGNTITGNRVDNLIDGGAGFDVMIGGSGNDSYRVDSLRDRIVERAGGGLDRVDSSVDHRLAAEVEHLQLSGAAGKGIGNALANRITGTAGGNLLDGRGGADYLAGGGGNDSYVIDDSGDRVIELAGGGSDAVLSSVGYTLRPELEALRLTGSAAVVGVGNELANIITGNAAANRLSGRIGDDRLLGGRGDDELIGGGGNDRFCFDTALNRFNNVDQILDFTRADDSIFLDCSVFTGIAEGRLDAAAFHNGATADDTADRILFDQAGGKLFYDADGSGDGAAVLFATLQPGATINQFDLFGYI